MAVFEYSAVDLDAKTLAGTVIADSGRQARDMLRDRGLTVTELRSTTQKTSRTTGLLRSRRNRAEVAGFVRRLSTLLRAGVPLLGALNTLAEQQHGRFKALIQGLADRVSAGVSLGDAMLEQPDCFDELCVSITHVGESTGSLDVALERLASFREKSQELRSQITTALIYPAVVCIVGLAVSVFLMTYVVPNLLKTLTQAGRELPMITRGVKAASDFLVGWWWALLTGLALLGLSLRALARSTHGRLMMDRTVLALPVLGDLVRKENTSRIAVVMAALLRSGVQFVDAVEITRRTIRNSVFRVAMADYAKAVSAGGDVAGPLKSSGVFSPMVVQMLAVGQQSGEIESLLEQLGSAYEHEVDVSAKRLTALLEPLLIILLAMVLGFIILATILPILEASNVL